MTNLLNHNDVVGEKFNRLTITEDLGTIGGYRQVIALCDCGKIKRLRLYHIKAEVIKSCGCLKQENLDKARFKHGLVKHPAYKLWSGIKRRCLNENDSAYKDYGGRGITICDEWKDDFKLFHDWAISNGYRKGLIIDRENVNGNYEPDNCRFVTTTVSARNTRASVFLTYNEETKTQAEWAEITGISAKKISRRLKRDKWTIERALAELL